MPGPAQNRGGGGGGVVGKLPPAPPKVKSGTSSYALASQQPKKSGSGLRILWIPGRKKNHDKGAYKPANFNIEHKHGDRKNEHWSLGGSKSQEEIVIGSE